MPTGYSSENCAPKSTVSVTVKSYNLVSFLNLLHGYNIKIETTPAVDEWVVIYELN